MASLATQKSRSPAKTTHGKRRGNSKTVAPPKSGNRTALTEKARKSNDPDPAPRTTKQECVLTLLSRPAGASIDEIMQATDWQNHSVRGFLAGTVKKKLGFNLTSSKDEGDVRRYRIETRRGH